MVRALDPRSRSALQDQFGEVLAPGTLRPDLHVPLLLIMVVAVPKFTPALARLPCDLCQGDNPVVLLRRVCVPQASAESKPVYISVMRLLQMEVPVGTSDAANPTTGSLFQHPLDIKTSHQHLPTCEGILSAYLV